MVIYKNGDLLESKCDIICHQVNLDGIMGGGLALQIARKYPSVEKSYKDFLLYHNFGENMLGIYCSKLVHEKWGKRLVVNCFTQNYDFTTDYEAVYKCFKRLLEDMRCVCGVKTIGIPYGYGCGIAKGEWAKVDEIIHKVFDDAEEICEVWKI